MGLITYRDNGSNWWDDAFLLYYDKQRSFDKLQGIVDEHLTRAYGATYVIDVRIDAALWQDGHIDVRDFRPGYDAVGLDWFIASIRAQIELLTEQGKWIVPLGQSIHAQ